jgi:hypothetical protein
MKVRFYLYLSIGILSLFIAGTSIYYLLGGFEEVRVYELSGANKVIVGRSFTGRQNSPVIEKYFTESKALILDSAIIGTLTVVQYKNDTLTGNEAQLFIGITLENEMAEIPSNYSVIELKSPKRFAVFLGMHPLVFPSPDKIETMLKSKAQEMGYDLEDYFVELHYIDNSMSVEGWTVNY